MNHTVFESTSRSRRDTVSSEPVAATASLSGHLRSRNRQIRLENKISRKFFISQSFNKKRLEFPASQLIDFLYTQYLLTLLIFYKFLQFHTSQILYKV
jgi:hypothetical protein